MAKVSQEWDEKVGVGKSVEWPAGIGGKGNEGVANVVKTTPYSIGYIELAYAFQNNIPYAAVENADGTNFVLPSMQSIAAASAGAAPALPQAHESWYGISIINAPGDDSYPISTFTYLLVYENLNNVTNDPDTAQSLVHMIHWMITDGQKFSESLHYVPIAPEVQKIGIDGLKRVQFNGESAWVESDTTSYVQPVITEQPTVVEESVPQPYEQPIVVQQTNNQSLSSEMELLSFYITALIALIAIAVILVIILIIVNMSLVASIKKKI